LEQKLLIRVIRSRFAKMTMATADFMEDDGTRGISFAPCADGTVFRPSKSLYNYTVFNEKIITPFSLTRRSADDGSEHPCRASAMALVDQQSGRQAGLHADPTG
jgi:hypothetical protein